MEQDIQAAHHREASMKNTFRRRILKLKDWRISQKGNPWIRRDGWTVTIFPRGNGFKAVLSREEQKIFLPQIFSSMDEAKLAAYEVMHASESAQQGVPGAGSGLISKG